MEEHQRILEGFIQREDGSALVAQADQYQTDLSKTIEAYKNLEKLLGDYQNERI